MQSALGQRNESCRCVRASNPERRHYCRVSLAESVHASIEIDMKHLTEGCDRQEQSSSIAERVENQSANGVTGRGRRRRLLRVRFD